MKIGIIQQANSADFSSNIEYSLAQISNCAKAGAELVVLQELHCGLYFCQTEDPDLFDQAHPIPGTQSEIFAKAARQNQVVLVASLFEKRAPGLYHNTAVVFEKDGRMVGKYRKMHIPDDPGYYEKFFFTPGDLGFQPIKTSIGKLGVLVCWDQWYPEGARLMALSGADVLIYPTAIGWDSSDDEEEKERQINAWETIQRSHAIANGLYVISVNRTGYEPDPTNNTTGITFWGKSFIAGPQGEIIYQSPPNEVDTKVIEIDLTRSDKVRRIWPFFRDRRIDAYHDLTRRFIDPH